MVRRKRRSRYDYRSKRKQGFFDSFGVNMWIVIFTSIVSILAFAFFVSFPDRLRWFALVPSEILAGNYLWTLFLHMFVHGGFAHLFVNMFVLVSLGKLCEQIIGRKRFLWFYLLSGLFAGILSVVLAGFFGYGFGERIFGAPDVAMVGASGAIFAVAGLLMMILPNLRFSIIFFPFFSLKAYQMIPLVLFLTWGLSIAFNWPIGNSAHFGGFLAGVVYGSYLRRNYGRKIRALQRYFR